jgi:membrane-associated phospholipid phosphatase
MLYGLLFVVAGRIQNFYVRNAVRSGSVGVLLLVGPARLWSGAHWPSDVIGAYTLSAPGAPCR